MDHHHGRTGGVARPDIDDMEFRAGDLDHPALRRIGALQGDHTGLRDQRQGSQRRHDNHERHSQCPDLWHQQATGLRPPGFTAHDLSNTSILTETHPAQSG
jgi:hypothetical protein